MSIDCRQIRKRERFAVREHVAGETQVQEERNKVSGTDRLRYEPPSPWQREPHRHVSAPPVKCERVGGSVELWRSRRNRCNKHKKAGFEPPKTAFGAVLDVLLTSVGFSLGSLVPARSALALRPSTSRPLCSGLPYISFVCKHEMLSALSLQRSIWIYTSYSKRYQNDDLTQYLAV
ncbi:uncharacterized protein ACNS7B_017208 [Menidia menidia]